MTIDSKLKVAWILKHYNPDLRRNLLGELQRDVLGKELTRLGVLGLLVAQECRIVYPAEVLATFGEMAMVT